MDIKGESSYSHHDDSIIQNEDEEQIQHEDHEDAQHSEAEIDKLSRRSSIKLLESVKISEVWQHFTKDINFKQNKKATCNHCNAIYTCFEGSTSNLKKHLTRRHLNKPQESNQLIITDVFNIMAKGNISIYIKIFYLSYIILIIKYFIFI